MSKEKQIIQLILQLEILSNEELTDDISEEMSNKFHRLINLVVKLWPDEYLELSEDDED